MEAIELESRFRRGEDIFDDAEAVDSVHELLHTHSADYRADLEHFGHLLAQTDEAGLREYLAARGRHDHLAEVWLEILGANGRLERRAETLEALPRSFLQQYNAAEQRLKLPQLITSWDDPTTEEEFGAPTADDGTAEHSPYVSPLFSPLLSDPWSPLSGRRRSSADIFNEEMQRLSPHAVQRLSPTIESTQETEEPDSVDVPQEAVEQGWGMPAANQLRFQSIADRYDVVIDVRPTNAEAVHGSTRAHCPSRGRSRPRRSTPSTCIWGRSRSISVS